MKKDLVKAGNVQVVQSLPVHNEFVMEKLDFSELANVKGGDKPPVDPPKGNSGNAAICWC